MSYATEGVKADVRELGVSGICNRKRRLVVTLLGFFREESHIICGLQRKEISSGGKYNLLTRASESGGLSTTETERTQRQFGSPLREKRRYVENIMGKEEKLLHLWRRLASRTGVDSGYSCAK